MVPVLKTLCDAFHSLYHLIKIDQTQQCPYWLQLEIMLLRRYYKKHRQILKNLLDLSLSPIPRCWAERCLETEYIFEDKLYPTPTHHIPEQIMTLLQAMYNAADEVLNSLNDGTYDFSHDIIQDNVILSSALTIVRRWSQLALQSELTQDTGLLSAHPAHRNLLAALDAIETNTSNVLEGQRFHGNTYTIIPTPIPTMSTPIIALQRLNDAPFPPIPTQYQLEASNTPPSSSIVPHPPSTTFPPSFYIGCPVLAKEKPNQKHEATAVITNILDNGSVTIKWDTTGNSTTIPTNPDLIRPKSKRRRTTT